MFFQFTEIFEYFPRLVLLYLQRLWKLPIATLIGGFLLRLVIALEIPQRSMEAIAHMDSLMDGPAPSRGGVTRAAGLIEPRLYRQLQFRVTNQVCSVIIGLEKFEPSESSSTVTRCQRELVPEQLEFEVPLRHRHTDHGLRATSTSPCQPDCLGVTLGLQVFNSTVTVPR